MSRDCWHIRQIGEVFVLSRHAGVRADGPGLWAETRLPAGLRVAALAHEIRKDVWRALRRLRGFSPVVEIQPCREETGLSVRAGGAITPQPPASLHRRLVGVLENPANRARWIAHAGKTTA